MSWLGTWRSARERRRRAAAYLDRALAPSDPAERQWLGALTGDPRLADRELAFAVRAVALIVAERDALDDRTASDVASALVPLLDAEARRSAAEKAAWVARWRGYSAAMSVRGHADAPAVRLARVLLDGAGVSHPAADSVDRAAEVVVRARGRANEALRATFGEASLPDDIRPSALRS